MTTSKCLYTTSFLQFKEAHFSKLVHKPPLDTDLHFDKMKKIMFELKKLEQLLNPIPRSLPTK